MTDGFSTTTKTVSFAIEGVNDAPVTDEGSALGNEDPGRADHGRADRIG